MNYKPFALLGISLFWAATACKPKQDLSKNTNKNPKNPPIEVVEMPQAQVLASPPNTFKRPIYNPSYERQNDLLHTDLKVAFNWSKQHLLGQAKLKLQPYFYPTDSLRLDAKGFDINKVVLLDANGKETPLNYTYNDKRNLYIKLPKVYQRNEAYEILIDYVAKPNELPKGGSAAITQDKGLYFINPEGRPGKPQQIWTQGETEASSCWFPTIDRPNERCTQTIAITVENRFKTLSNGLLQSSTPNPDGTRTDYWVMDKPHAPYLFMMAIGEFAVVQDKWRDLELTYYVEPEYQAYAKDIFPHTPEMLTFFSEKLGVDYPWQKYAQVIVRDYVSGAMENTTAVIFGDFVQKTRRSLIDGTEMNEGIVAHEMMHHWFGDLVTCESWANLPLNESFANYSEYLWFEYKHGPDAANYHHMRQTSGYMTEALVRSGKKALIRFEYKDKEDMFDAHSYNKGGTILHMLRRYLGDQAFFASLQYYLKTHSYQAAEVHDLRLAFEKVTGKDLNWFFNQWFLTPGHPKLEIQRQYDAKTKEVVLSLEQVQSLENSTVFILPIDIEIHDNQNNKQRYRIEMRDQKQVFRFPAPSKPRWVAVDADRSLLAERNEEQSLEEWAAQYQLANNLIDRMDALAKLRSEQANPIAKTTLSTALKDPFWGIRNQALEWLDLDPKDKALFEQIAQMANQDPRPNVRAEALLKLSKANTPKGFSLLGPAQIALERDSSYSVLSAALMLLGKENPQAAMPLAKKLETEDNGILLLGIAELYVEQGQTEQLAFFENRWAKTDGYASINFFDAYARFLLRLDQTEQTKSKVAWLHAQALNSNNTSWARYGMMAALRSLEEGYANKNAKLASEIKALIQDVKNKETDPDLLRYYRNF